jgi:thiol-disulfide isomerase/thioredoxin
VMAVQVGLVLLYLRVERERAGRGVSMTMERRLEPGHDVVVERSDGSRLTLTARSSEYQLVHFWATWCPPCLKEIPSLSRLAERGPSRLRVWAVSADRDWKDLREFFRGDVPGHVVRDPLGNAARVYSVRQLPDTYLVDPAGRVIARFAARQQWDTEEMRATLERLTGGS